MLCSAKKLHTLSGLLPADLTGRKIYTKGTCTFPANDTHTTPQKLHPNFDTCVPLPRNSHNKKIVIFFKQYLQLGPYEFFAFLSRKIQQTTTDLLILLWLKLDIQFFCFKWKQFDITWQQCLSSLSYLCCKAQK